MGSYTSSSERSAWILTLAAALVLGAATMNAHFPDAEYAYQHDMDRFWQHKAQEIPDNSADVVLSGDSRVYRGLSPDAFQSVLPGERVLNFGFSSGGHNPIIFSEIDRILGQSPHKAVVLGITPWSLTAKAQENEQYLQYKKRPPELSSRWQAAGEALRPLTWTRVKKIAKGKNNELPGGVINDFLPNGWVRSDFKKRDPMSAIASYEHGFDGNTVEAHAIDDVLRQTRRWSKDGVLVIGYRPPTTPAMVALENAKSGFDETLFAKHFREAGGIWVNLPDDFESYDGSHLTPESAEKLSRILAEAIEARQ